MNGTTVIAALKSAIRAILGRFDLVLRTTSAETNIKERISRLKRNEAAMGLLLDAAGIQSSLLVELAQKSSSQVSQDLFAAYSSGLRRSGFFVEFGAGDGVRYSNTLLLEAELGWTGILAEPLRRYHEQIRSVRAAPLETDCVWSRTGETLTFVEKEYMSGVEDAQSRDWPSELPRHQVPTISLLDLLVRHGAPSTIDYLSIDTEGSEFAILEAFPFNGPYRIMAISCEHNYGPMREKIFGLLVANGYRRVGRERSSHDDWFVLDTEESRQKWAAVPAIV